MADPKPKETIPEFSLSLERRAGLINRLGLMAIGIVVLLIFLNFTKGKPTVHWSYISIIAALAIAIVVNRFGYFKVAASFGLLAIDAVVYILASSEPYETGVCLHFVTTGFAGIIFFTREHKWYGIGFGLLSVLLYDLAAIGNMPVVEYRHVPLNEIRTLFIINSSVCTFCCILILHSIMQLNSKVKDDLTAKKMEINFQNQILVKSNAELDRFVYSASHDLRAPLSSIAGLIDLIHRDRSDTDKYLAMIKDRIGVMDRFITEVIDYSRNARLGVKKEKLILKPLIDEVVNLLKYSVPKQIEVFNNVSPLIEIETDGSRLQVVLSNLISNAIKYSDLRKTSPFIKISAEITNTECRISVADNGIGIHKEHQSKIFDMFYRATDRSKGSGLGLFIVKETLEKLGGQMEVISEHGVGSVFKIRLPIATVSSKSQL